MSFIRRTFVLIGLIMLTSFVGLHKYYVSVTDIDYIQKEKTIQVTSRLFIDDFEAMLSERYGQDVKLENKDIKAKNNSLIAKYYAKKLIIEVNGAHLPFQLLGFVFEDDQIVSYFEITEVDSIQEIKITNKLLFELERSQQNITHININSKKKSFLFEKENDSGMLKF